MIGLSCDASILAEPVVALLVEHVSLSVPETLSGMLYSARGDAIPT